MSKDHQITTHTDTRENKGRCIDSGDTFRVYKSSPSRACLQLWSYGSIREYGSGADRSFTTSASVTADQLDKMIEALQAVRAEF